MLKDIKRLLCRNKYLRLFRIKLNKLRLMLTATHRHNNRLEAEIMKLRQEVAELRALLSRDNV
jgi:hypothetical protein